MDVTALTPEQRDARLALDVERLLRFGRKHKLIKDLDEIVARNTLLDLLALPAPSEEKLPKENPETPAVLLDEMVELAARKGLLDGSVDQYHINFETRLMGALMLGAVIVGGLVEGLLGLFVKYWIKLIPPRRESVSHPQR